MSKHLHRDLDNLHQKLLAMASLVEHALHHATQALQDRNLELAREAIVAEEQIDKEETEIEDQCHKILALHAPVAVDLRTILVALKINTELERMGDLAEDIAKRSISLEQLPDIPVPRELQKMTDLAATMVRQSLDAFVNRETSLARRVCRLDDQVDDYNREIKAEMVRIMETTPSLVAAALCIYSTSKHLERIADHATNIAEDVIYLMEGEIVRHRLASREPDEDEDSYHYPLDNTQSNDDATHTDH